MKVGVFWPLTCPLCCKADSSSFSFLEFCEVVSFCCFLVLTGQCVAFIEVVNVYFPVSAYCLSHHSFAQSACNYISSYKSMRLCFTGGFHASDALVTVKQLGLHMGWSTSRCATTRCSWCFALRSSPLHFSRKAAFGSFITSHLFFAGQGCS